MFECPMFGHRPALVHLPNNPGGVNMSTYIIKDLTADVDKPGGSIIETVAVRKGG